MSAEPIRIIYSIPEGPQGPKGDQGVPGPAVAFSIAEVLAVPYSEGATVTLTGTATAREFHFRIPSGPPNQLAIGTVLTGAAGSAATATITGTWPNQLVNFVIPQGQRGQPADPAITDALQAQVNGLQAAQAQARKSYTSYADWRPT